MKLGVNVDHVATLRNLRGTTYPCIITAARTAMSAGASFITVHLREDRRHVSDQDLEALICEKDIPINLEMAATEEMAAIALKHRPQHVCLVPEKRNEVTTEAGLDVVSNAPYLREYVRKLKGEGIKVSLFLDPTSEQIEKAKEIDVDVVELHVGEYCNTRSDGALAQIVRAAALCTYNNIECHAGHGIDYSSAQALSQIQSIACLNVGHFLICESVTTGLHAAVRRMIDTISRK